MSDDEKPVVPEEDKKVDEDDENRLEGTISSGDLDSDFTSMNDETKESSEEEKKEDTPEEGQEPEAPAEEEIPEEQEQKEDEKTEDNNNNEKGEEQMEEENPTPILGSAKSEEPVETPVEAEAAPAAEAVIPEPKKKSKKGLIITLIIVALVLIGGGVGFAIWAMIYESPEVALRDAFANVWKEDNVKIDGSLAVKSNGSDVKLDIEGARSGKNISGSGTFEVTYGGQEIKVKYSASYIDKGNLYFKLDGLKDLVDSLNLDETMASGSDFSDILSSILGSVVEKVDGSWYKIEADDIKEYNSGAGCVLENLGSLFEQDSMDAIANSYKDHSFIELDKDAKVEESDGAKYYTIKINKREGVEFVKNAKSSSLESLRKCIDADNAKASESDDNGTTVVKVGVTPWSHKLIGVKVKGDNSSSLDLKIKYDKVDISEPSGAKSIEQLMEDVQEAISGAMTAIIKQTCEAVYGDYGEAYVQTCIESASESMGEQFDINSLLEQFGIGASSKLEDCTDSDETDC